MAIIYVYKFKDNKLDVFEADTLNKFFSEDRNKIMCHAKELHFREKEVIVKYTKCVFNGSGKGITQHDKRCASVIATSGTVYRNLMWLHEYDLAKAAEIFKDHNNKKIKEYNKLLSELEESNSSIDKFTKLCTHKYPDGNVALERLSDGKFQCKICSNKFTEGFKLIKGDYYENYFSNNASTESF